MFRNRKYLQILTILSSISQLSCIEESSRGFPQLNVISANNEDIQLTTYKSGSVVTLEEKHFPLKIICKARFPTAWKLYKSKNNATRFKRELHENGIDYLNIMLLNLPNQEIVGKYSCEGLDSPNCTQFLYIYLKLTENSQSVFLEPRSKQEVMLLLGNKRILLPCRLMYESMDVYVEKSTLFSSRKVDLPFDPLENAFYIDTAGTFEDLTNYVGKYRCIQAGYGEESFVMTEVKGPIDHISSQSENQMIGTVGVPVELSCSSVSQIEMEISGGTEEFTVTNVFKPKQRFHYSALFNWIPSITGLFNIQCKLRNGGIVQAWLYRVVESSVSLNIDANAITCSSKNGLSPKLLVSYCRTYDECFLSKDKAEKTLSVSTDYAIVDCGTNCKKIRPTKTGGYWVFCAIEGKDSKSKLYFADLDLQLRSLNEKVGMEAVVKMLPVKENSEGIQVTTCKWSLFFLAENVVWYFTEKEEKESEFTKQIRTETSELTKLNLDGSLESTVKFRDIEDALSDTGPTFVKCSLTLWNRNSVHWNTHLLKSKVFKPSKQTYLDDVQHDDFVPDENPDKKIWEVFFGLLFGLLFLIVVAQAVVIATFMARRNKQDFLTVTTESRNGRLASCATTSEQSLFVDSPLGQRQNFTNQFDNTNLKLRTNYSFNTNDKYDTLHQNVRHFGKSPEREIPVNNESTPPSTRITGQKSKTKEEDLGFSSQEDSQPGKGTSFQKPDKKRKSLTKTKVIKSKKKN